MITPKNIPFGKFIAVHALALILSSVSHGKTFYNINGGTVNSDWSLTNNGITYEVVTKPTPIAAGMTAPWVDNTLSSPVPGAHPIGFNIDAGWPANDASLQKLHYRIVTGNGTDPAAAGVTTPNIRYVGFWLYFDPSYQLNNGPVEPIGTELWQAWQGSGWPPLQLRTDESSGQIHLYLLSSNDHCRGSLNSNSGISYLGQSFNRGQWYKIVIGMHFDAVGTSGWVKAWVNNALAVNWTGMMGYTSKSSSDTTLDSCDSHFGLYQQQTGTLHRVWFDNLKWADNYADADPAIITAQIGDIADSYVYSASAGTNSGTATQLLTKSGGATRLSLLKFNTSSLPKNAVFDSAALLLFGNLSTSDPLPSATVSCYAVSDDTWTETGVTWTNRPTLGAKLSSADVANSSPNFWGWDVTDFFASQRSAGFTTTSLALQNDTTTTQNCYFNSRENSTNRPVLSITYHLLDQPENLTATAGDTQVALVWTESVGASSYNIKRATVSGGPYTTIATGVSSTSFSDTGVVNGTTYFYVISAEAAGVESLYRAK